MNYRSHADLGGTANGHAVLADRPELLFHAAWEPRVLALVVAMGTAGLWNIDMSRSARETLPDYAALSYYEIWLAALEKLLLASGAITSTELREGRMLQAAAPHNLMLDAESMAATLRRGSSAARAPNRPARFAQGQRVRTIAQTADHHTRLPAYARGKQGVVEKQHGTHVFPDSQAHGKGETPQWLYTVTFDATELWGAEKFGADSVSIDAWEPYLEAV